MNKKHIWITVVLSVTLLLLVVIGTSGLTLMDTYKLTITASNEEYAKDLEDQAVFSVYRVATVTPLDDVEDYVFTEDGWASDELKNEYNSIVENTAVGVTPDWRPLAQLAANQLVDGKITPEIAATVKFGDTVDLEPGLYLVMAGDIYSDDAVVELGTDEENYTGKYTYKKNTETDDVIVQLNTKDYKYLFSQAMIQALPYRASTAEEFDGHTIDLKIKIDRREQTGTLVIRKKLETYSVSDGPDAATFSFQVAGLDESDPTATRMYTLIFDSTGEKEIKIIGIPIGTKVTVTEDDNPLYQCLNPVQSETIDSTEEVFELEFVNNYVPRLSEHGSIDNHFEYGENGWDYVVKDADSFEVVDDLTEEGSPEE